jgi:hypothetical protein
MPTRTGEGVLRFKPQKINLGRMLSSAKKVSDLFLGKAKSRLINKKIILTPLLIARPAGDVSNQRNTPE